MAHPARADAGYVALHRSGELARRARAALELLDPCRLCPRRCGVARSRGESGFCGSGIRAGVSHHLPHFGEEPPLSGGRGAGAVFFSSCNLSCLACQNHQISQWGLGRLDTTRDLADRMLDLQRQGCHSVEWVSPTHVVPAALGALDLAASDGLTVPIVYNSNGYDGPEALELLDGVVDIYLPDAKYSSDDAGREISGCEDYVRSNRVALEEMRRQVGDLKLNERGIATRGMIVRLLVLPHDLAGCYETLGWIAERLGRSVWLSVMSQYAPRHRAAGHPRLGRRLVRPEYDAVVAWIERLGFTNYFLQGFESQDACVPDFARHEPFDFREVGRMTMRPYPERETSRGREGP